MVFLHGTAVRSGSIQRYVTIYMLRRTVWSTEWDVITVEEVYIAMEARLDGSDNQG